MRRSHSQELETYVSFILSSVILLNHASPNQVSISDLKSHHGTHVMKAGDTKSAALAPDMPHYLTEGDVITFGKTVGHDESLVRPVVARVRLISSLSPLPAAPTTPVSSSSPSGPASAATGRGTSTGRYGLSSSASSWSQSSSDADSDSEELEPINVRPPFSFRRAPWRGFLPPPLPPRPPMCNSAARLGLLRSYLPQPHMNAFADVPDDVLEDVDLPQIAIGAQSPIEISSASPSPSNSRSPSVVEVQAPAQSQSQSERNVVGAWPSSVSSSREPSPSPPRDESKTDHSNHFSVVMHLDDFPAFPLEPELEHEPEAKVSDPETAGSDIEQGVEKADASTQHAEKLLDTFVCAMNLPYEDESHCGQLRLALEECFERMSQSSDPPREDSASNFAGPSSSSAPVVRQFTFSRPDDTNNTDAEVDDSADDDDDSDDDDSSDGNDADTSAKEHNDADMQTEIEDAHLAQIKSVVEGKCFYYISPRPASLTAVALAAMAEFRTKIEAERAQEQEAFKAKLAEAEALAAEAKALALKHAEAQAQAQAQVTSPTEQQTVSPSPYRARFREAEAYLVQPSSATSSVSPFPSTTSSLKRKRDETEDEDERISSSSSSPPAPAPVANNNTIHDHARPVKRQRSMAMRVASGVAKTTAIAAVGAVATWSALAFA